MKTVRGARLQAPPPDAKQSLRVSPRQRSVLGARRQRGGKKLHGTQQERSRPRNKLRNAGSGPQDEDKAAGGKTESEEEQVWCEILRYKENLGFQKNCTRIGVRKLLRMGLVPARAWEGQADGIAPTERLELMAGAAGNSWK